MTAHEINTTIRWIRKRPTITDVRYTDGRPAIEVYRDGRSLPCALIPVVGDHTLQESAERHLAWAADTPAAEWVLESQRLEALAATTSRS
jgi:hypothetical protein